MGLQWLLEPLCFSQEYHRASGLPFTLTSAGAVAKGRGSQDQGTGQRGLVEMVPALCPGLSVVVVGRGQAGQVTRSHSTSAN